MLSRARLIGIIPLLLICSACSKKDSPTISYPELRVDDDSSNSQLLTQQEEDEIIRFVKTVRGIDHRVQEIEVKSHDQVEVKTGPLNPLEFKKDRHGDSLLLRKNGGQWTLVERSSWSFPATKDEGGIYIWDGTSELAIVTDVTDSVTHRPIFGAMVTVVRVGRDSEPLGKDHPATMPPPQKTSRGGRAQLVAYFRAAGDAEGFCVFVGDSFVRVEAQGYQSQEARLSPIVRLDFPRRTEHCQVAIPITLTHQ